VTIDDLLANLRARDACLYVEGGQLKYAGPRLAPDHPLRAAIAEHRDELIVMFAPARELCVFLDALLARGDRIFCAGHRAEAKAILMPWDRRLDPGNVSGLTEQTSGPVSGHLVH
jgi:hypothetical protein